MFHFVLECILKRSTGFPCDMHIPSTQPGHLAGDGVSFPGPESAPLQLFPFPGCDSPVTAKAPTSPSLSCNVPPTQRKTQNLTPPEGKMILT